MASLVLAALALSSRAPRVVFTDCDGTMLRPDHTLSPGTSQMLHRLREKDVLVVPATGRARAGPWTDAVLNAHPALAGGSPGVFINGCSAFDENGRALVSTFLPERCVRRVLGWHESPEAEGHGLVAYIGGEAQYVRGGGSYVPAPRRCSSSPCRTSSRSLHGSFPCT